MTWTVSPIAVTCGSCGRVIAAGEPLQHVTAKRLVRCIEHALGPVNHTEIDLERFRLEREAIARESSTLTVGQSRPAARPTSRFDRDRALPFDRKSAAAGRDE